MNARNRFILAVIVLGLLMTGPFIVTSLLVLLDTTDQERTQLIHLLTPRLPLGFTMTAFGFVIGLIVVSKLFHQYVKGLSQMGENLRLMLGANRNFRVEVAGPPEVQMVAEATNALAEQRDVLMADVAAQIATAKASVEEEKNRLAALMSELAQAVVVCNRDGRILLYNNRARLQFRSLAQGPTTVAGGAMIGLGRSIFSILDRNQIDHALEIVRHRLERGVNTTMANFVTTTRSGQLLRVQLVPVCTVAASSESEEEGASSRPQREMSGYVLTVENITRSFEESSRRDQALQSLTHGQQTSLANLRASLAHLDAVDGNDNISKCAAEQQLQRTLVQELAHMGRNLDEFNQEFADGLKMRWPLEDVLGVDVIAAAQRRIKEQVDVLTKTEEMDEQLWIKSDSFSLVFAITFIAARLADHYEIRELRFRLLPASKGKQAYLDVIWSGHAMSSETFYTWELDNMEINGEVSPLSVRDVIERHGGQLIYEREKAAHRAFFRFVLPAANPEILADEGEQQGSARPEYYDFDLFKFQNTGIDLDCKLSDLAYTVFDTETTGLDPTGGDEIIQIGAARLLNNRLLRRENFDQLVDPERPLRPEGIPIHGITEDMVRGQPTIDVVLPAFHAFCSDTVLVAHNAAFDMRFLELKEERTKLRFGQPVLDTLLLSAVIHPNQDSHKLEDIAKRLGIQIEGRHNALGDAYATGEVFLKMVPLLADKGITTLRQALDAAQKTYFARVKY
jgi:DNA polymerase-3 subunit epsilon